MYVQDVRKLSAYSSIAVSEYICAPGLPDMSPRHLRINWAEIKTTSSRPQASTYPLYPTILPLKYSSNSTIAPKNVTSCSSPISAKPSTSPKANPTCLLTSAPYSHHSKGSSAGGVSITSVLSLGSAARLCTNLRAGFLFFGHRHTIFPR
jgi:hypothetical protein